MQAPQKNKYSYQDCVSVDYTARSLPCRTFDCRADPRCWPDYAAGVINPLLNLLTGRAAMMMEETTP